MQGVKIICCLLSGLGSDQLMGDYRGQEQQQDRDLLLLQVARKQDVTLTLYSHSPLCSTTSLYQSSSRRLWVIEGSG